MCLLVETLRGKQIDDVLVDSELVYMMLRDGTQVTIRGLVAVEPPSHSMRTTLAVDCGEL